MKDSHIKSFTANVLTELDHGALGVELNRQLQVLARDIIDRPMNAHGKPTPARKLKLAFELRPIIEFDHVNKRVALVPFGGELERVERMGFDALQGLLSEQLGHIAAEKLRLIFGSL